jgi:hypothetical protein
MFSVILYMLRQTFGRRASPLPFPSFFSSSSDVSEARSYFASTIHRGVRRPGRMYTLSCSRFVQTKNNESQKPASLILLTQSRVLLKSVFLFLFWDSNRTKIMVLSWVWAPRGIVSQIS